MFHSLVLKISEEMLKEFVAGLILCHHVVLVGAGQMENDRNLQLNWIAVCSCHECFRSFLLATSPSFWAQVGYCEAAQNRFCRRYIGTAIESVWFCSSYLRICNRKSFW